LNILRTLASASTLGAIGLLLASAASADTLELKDGRVLQGRFLGGTQTVMRFELNGEVRTFSVNDIVALTFTNSYHDQDNAPGPPAATPPPAAPPAQDNNTAPPDAPPSGPNGNGNSQNGNAPNANASDTNGSNGNSADAPPPPPAPNAPQSPNGSPNGPSNANSPSYSNSSSYSNSPSYSSARSSATAPAAPGSPITLPAGQSLLIRMIDGVDSKKNNVGDVFHASLETDLTLNGTLVAHRGADVYGKLAYAKEAGHLSGSSELELELTRLVVDGRDYPLVSDDYTLKGKGRGGDTAKKVGGGAVLGAIIGGIAGGGAGAAIGAGVGGAAGAGVQVFTRGKEVKVPSETLLEFKLQQPSTVNVTTR
jgi:hypothetical protein